MPNLTQIRRVPKLLIHIEQWGGSKYLVGPFWMRYPGSGDGNTVSRGGLETRIIC